MVTQGPAVTWTDELVLVLDLLQLEGCSRDIPHFLQDRRFATQDRVCGSREGVLALYRFVMSRASKA